MFIEVMKKVERKNAITYSGHRGMIQETEEERPLYRGDNQE